MAIFNPQIQPTQDPNYLNYSRSVDAPSPDMSAKLAIDTVTGLVDGAVSTIDTSIKKGISDTAYKLVDPLRNEMTAGLEKLKSNLDQGIIPAPAQTVAGSSTSPRSILDANASMDEPDLPAGLESGLGRVNALAAAKAANSPKLNDTKYAGETLAVAKQLRAQYPGYREYIDEQVSKASGLPVANSYYQNMLQDINRQLTQMGKTKDDIGNQMMKNLDVPNMASYIDMRKAGDPKVSDSFVLHKIADWQNLQTQIKIDAAKRAEGTDNKKDIVDQQTQSLNKVVSDGIAFEVSGAKDIAGLGTYKDLTKFFQDYSAGKLPQVTEAQVQQKKLLFNAWVANVESRYQSIGSGYGTSIGGKEAEGIVKAKMAPVYAMRDFVNSKDDGPAYYIAHQVEAIQKQATQNFLINKDTGKESQQLYGARAILGDQYFPTFVATFLNAGTDLKYGAMFNQEAMSAIQPYSDDRGVPANRYMIDAIQHAKKAGVGKDNPKDQEYYGKITQLVSGIADPKMPLTAKDKLIEWGFNPKNIGRLDELKMDYTDPNTGQKVPGKYRAFNILSAPAITQGVKESSAVNPDNYVKYQGTLESEFGSLYRADVKSLNKILEKPYLNAHFSYNDQTSSFGLVDNKNRPILRNDRALGVEQPNAVYLNGVLDILDRVNGGVKSMANVYKNNPVGEVDVHQRLLQMLQTSGFRPGDNISGATTGMMKAIIKSQSPEMTPEQLDKQILKITPPVPAQGLDISASPPISRFAAEKKGPSVSEFVSNPTGEPLPKASKGVKGNLSDEQLMNIQTDEIPEGMSAREFIKQLQSKR